MSVKFSNNYADILNGWEGVSNNFADILNEDFLIISFFYLLLA